MHRIQKSIDVNAPLPVVYGQWTRFEEFPQFMAGVKEVYRMENPEECEDNDEDKESEGGEENSSTSGHQDSARQPHAPLLPRLYWRAEIMGQSVEWEAEITQQRPGDRIAWRSVVGHPNTGEVRFSAINSVTTEVTVTIEYEPLGVAETLADFLGALSLRVEGDLKRFKDFIESQEIDTGIWRGLVGSGIA